MPKFYDIAQDTVSRFPPFFVTIYFFAFFPSIANNGTGLGNTEEKLALELKLNETVVSMDVVTKDETKPPSVS